MIGGKRFAGVVAILAVVLAGCAKVSPVAPTAATTSAPPALEIGTDGTPTMDLVAALYAAALQADGQPASVVTVVPGTETLAVADHSPVAMPVFAGTLLRQFNAESSAEPSDVVSALATAVAGELLNRLADAQAAGGVPQIVLTGGTIAEAIHRTRQQTEE